MDRPQVLMPLSAQIQKEAMTAMVRRAKSANLYLPL
jgi:hypothetical protein